MNCRTRIAAMGVAAMATAFSLSSEATTVYLKEGGEYTDGIDLTVEQGTVTETDASQWASRYTDGLNVHSGADYIYSSSYLLDGAVKSMSAASAMIRVNIYQDPVKPVDRTFAGDSLQVGSIDEPKGSFNMKQRRVCTTLDAYGKYAKLILCDGNWYLGGSESVYVGIGGGEIEVKSPASKPFHFYSAIASGSFTDTVKNGQTHGTWSIRSALKGESDVALKFSLNDAAAAFPFDFRLTGDNSSYKGKFVVRNAGARLAVASSAALGASASLTADAVTLADGAALAAPDGADVTLESATRGVTIDATGGRLSAASGSRLVVRLPIAGSGAVRVCGGGEVVLDGDYQAGAITVDGDTLFTIGSSADLHGASVVYEGGRVLPLPADGVTNELDFAANDGATIVFYHGDDRKTLGCYELTTVSATWPVALTVKGDFVRPAADATFPVLRIPTSLKTVTADDFFLSTTTPYDHRLTVETGADGMQTVVLNFPAVLGAKDLNNNISTWTNGSTTVDAYAAKQNNEGEAFAQQYADYAWNMTLGSTRRISAPLHVAPYLGSPFSVKGLGAGTSELLNFCLKTKDYTWSDLRLYGCLYLYGNSVNATIRGKMSIFSSEAAPTQLQAVNENATTLTIAADVCGDGYAQLMPNAAKSGARTIAFTGDNSRFLGTFDACAYGTATQADVATNFIYWTVSSANGFGGNPATFTADAVRLGGGTVLQVASSLTMPHVNRGFTVREWPTIYVAAGQTFRICSKTTVKGTLTKAGDGLLVLDDVAAEAGAKLVVAEGAVSFGTAVPAELDVDYASGEIALPAAGATAAWPGDAPRGAKLCFTTAADGTTSGCFEMSADAKADFWPIGVVVNLAARPAAAARFPILRVPTSVRAVALTDFYSASRTPASESYALETDDDGMQTLYVSFPEVLTATRLQNSEPQTIWRRADGTCVTNSEDAACAYRVSEKSLDGTSDQFRVNKLSNPFAGQSLSVAREAGTETLKFPLRFSGAVIPGFRLYGNVALQKVSGLAMDSVGGDLTVLGTEEAPTSFGAQHDNDSFNASFTYAGSLRGDGYLVFAPIGSGSVTLKQPRIGLSGDNANFVGTMDVTADAATRASLTMFDSGDGSRTNNLTLEVSSATALGGARPAFDAKALRLGWSSVLKILCDVTLAENRGFYVYDSPCIDVAEGKTFAVGEKTTVNGTLTKTGAGALKLAGVVAASAAAGANVVEAEAGSLVLTKPEAVRDVKFVAPSATLVLSRDATACFVNEVDDQPFGASGEINLVWAEGKSPADEPAAYKWIEVPVLEAKTTAIADIRSRIRFSASGRTAYEFVEQSAGDGMTRLVLRVKVCRGAVMIIR